MPAGAGALMPAIFVSDEDCVILTFTTTSQDDLQQKGPCL